jgi:hypothetical protein
MSKLAKSGKADHHGLLGDARNFGHERPHLVMHEGRVGGVFDRKDATQETIMRAATGHDELAAV